MVKDDLNLGGVFEAAMEIAMRQQCVMNELRNALEARNDLAALELARTLTGLSPRET